MTSTLSSSPPPPSPAAAIEDNAPIYVRPSSTACNDPACTCIDHDHEGEERSAVLDGIRNGRVELRLR